MIFVRRDILRKVELVGQSMFDNINFTGNLCADRTAKLLDRKNTGL